MGDFQVEVEEAATKPEKESELVSQKLGDDSQEKTKVVDQTEAMKISEGEIKEGKNESSPNIEESFKEESTNDGMEKNPDAKLAKESPRDVEHTKKSEELEIEGNSKATVSADKMDSVEAQPTVNENPIEKSRIENESEEGK